MIRGGGRGVGIGVMAPGYALDSSPIACNNVSMPWSPAALGSAVVGWWETDTSQFPNAVLFPADPLVDGNMELAGVANWPAAGAVATKIPDPRPGSSGTQALNLAVTGVWGYSDQIGRMVPGNTYIVEAWVHGDGAGHPELWDDGTGAVAVGTASAVYQHIISAPFVAVGTGVGLVGSSGVCVFDDVQLHCMNASQVTDLSGNGHHLVQPTATDQPLWVPSGAAGILRWDGVNDVMACAIPGMAQPIYEIVALERWPLGNPTWLSDADTSSLLSFVQVSRMLEIYAGTGLLGPSWVGDPPMIVDALFDGATSFIGLNGAAPTVGPAGSTCGNGFTLGATGIPNSLWSGLGFIGSAIVNRPLTTTERAQIVAYFRAKGAKCGVVIP